MKVKQITLLSDLEDINDLYDSNLDVWVKLENGHKYIIVVATYKNLLTLMNNEKLDFVSPGDPMIIVRKLTKRIIESAIKVYAEEADGYFLKLHAAQLDNKTLDVLKDRSVAKNKLLHKLAEEGKSLDIGNSDLIDFEINDYDL